MQTIVILVVSRDINDFTEIIRVDIRGEQHVGVLSTLFKTGLEHQ